MKKKKKTNGIKDLYLDRPTSHGGWPGGHEGGYTDKDTPVYKQIANYLKVMGLIDDSNPRAKLSESLEQLDEVDIVIRELSQFDGVDDTTMASYFIELLADYMSTGRTMSVNQAKQLSSIILKIYAGSHKEMRDREDAYENEKGIYPQQDQINLDHFNKKYSAHRAFHDSFELLVGPQRDEYDSRNCWWWPIRPGDVDEIYRMFVKANLVKRSMHTKLSEDKIRALIREALSNYPPGVTGTEDYFYGEDLPSENADIEDIIKELEETLEDYAVELGYIPEDDDKALRKAYDEDPDFYNDLYDEVIMSRKKTRNLF